MAEPLAKKASPDTEQPSKGYEFLDHTADIQVHSWGASLKESFEQATVAMFAYMTELDKITIDESLTSEFEVEGNQPGNRAGMWHALTDNCHRA
eukprot:m.58134 g.58134  ORF g.58134 m.58134 type:complete len:94 (+) comp13755_c0_seq4:976-1257(+)